MKKEELENIKKALGIIWMLTQDQGDLVTKEERLWLMEYLTENKENNTVTEE